MIWSGPSRPIPSRPVRMRSTYERHQRPHVRVHDRRRRALVLALLAQDLRGQRDARVRQLLGEDRAEPLLVRGVEVRVEEADGHGLDAERRAAVRRPRGTPPRRAARSTVPSTVTRSFTSNRSRRSTSGGGLRQKRSYMCGIRSRRSSRTSRKPAVVTSAVRLPRRSSTAFVATVVPCTTSLTSPSPASAETASITARS